MSRRLNAPVIGNAAYQAVDALKNAAQVDCRRPRRSRASDPVSQLPVAGGVPWRDFPQCFPDTALEGRPPGLRTNVVECSQVAVEVFAYASRDLLGRTPRGQGVVAMVQAQQLVHARLAIPEVQRMQHFAVGDQQHGAKRRVEAL